MARLYSGRVAQLVEQRTLNPRVVGSIPTALTLPSHPLEATPTAVSRARRLPARDEPLRRNVRGEFTSVAADRKRGLAPARAHAHPAPPCPHNSSGVIIRGMSSNVVVCALPTDGAVGRAASGFVLRAPSSGGAVRA
jgi:hypothetical protein